MQRRHFIGSIAAMLTTQVVASQKVKAIMMGDSGMYGSLGQGRLAVYPQLTINANQSVFDFCYDYSKPGAGWQHIFSSSSGVRALGGLPNGITLEALLQSTDAQAILFGLGANDYNHIDDVINGVNEAARLCKLYGKVFGFIGIADANATTAYNYDPPAGLNFYQSGYLQVGAKLAGVAEVLRQVCLHEQYPFADIRNNIRIDNWDMIVGDVVHPSQNYSISIYKYIAQVISAT